MLCLTLSVLALCHSCGRTRAIRLYRILISVWICPNGWHIHLNGTLAGRPKEIIRKAVEPEPALRYASPKELKEALENYLKPGWMQVLEPPLSKTREFSGRKQVFAALGNARGSPPRTEFFYGA